MATVGAGAPAGAALQTANGAEAAIPGSSNEKSTAAPTSSPERSGKEAKPGLWARWMADLPPWLTDALHSRRAWKNFARSMIALFVALVIMVVRPSLVRIGQATFFILIVSTMLPPSMPLSLYGFAIFTLGLGMLFGWAWGCAAWASALHVRDKAQTQRNIQAAYATFDQTKPIQPQLQKAIFSAMFLDPRSSAVFGVFTFIGAYAFAWLRAVAPKLTFVSIFGTILMDLMVTIGPLFPQQYYKIASVLLEPAAAFMAIGIVCTLLFFPQSLSHLVMSTLVGKGLPPIQGLLSMQDQVLKTKPSDHEAWGTLAHKAGALRAGFAASSAALDSLSKMLQLEVTRGRISAAQLGKLVKVTRELGMRAFGLGSFVVMVQEGHVRMEQWLKEPLPHHTNRSKMEAVATVDAEQSSGRSLEDLLPVLELSTRELRQAAQDALNGAAAFLDEINNTRWKKAPADAPTTADRDKQRQHLADTLAQYRKSGHFEILAPFKDLFDPVTGELKPAPEKHLTGSIRGLFRCFVFTSSLISFCVTLQQYLDYVHLIEISNPKSKLQFPGKFVESVVENATDPSTGDNQYGLGVNEPLQDNDFDDHSSATSSTSKTHKGKKKRHWPKDPDARDPTNGFQRFGRGLSRVGRGLSGPNGLYAFRYALVSVALWIPSVCTSSAKFYYDNKGLWALIMSQTGLGIVTGEQIYNLVSRTLGTIVGVVCGMVAWYIGAQKGNGNPYGIIATTMVFTAPFLFCRIAAPPQAMGFWIMTAVTITFTVGYSWVDMNVPQVSNPGAGYTLAGRRALLVIIGFAAGAIVVMFPRPVSAKKLVREGIAKNIAGIAELYGREISALERSRDDKNIDVEERRKQYQAPFMKLYGRLQMIQSRIGFAGMELNTRGPWPKDKYLALVHTQSSMLAACATVASSYVTMDAAWIKRLTNKADVLHPGFVADCFSLFALLRHSLRQGVPLPPNVPIFERLLQYRRSSRTKVVASRAVSRLHTLKSAAKTAGDSPAGSVTSSRAASPAPSDGDEERRMDDEDETMVDTDKALWDTFRDELTWSACHDEQFATMASCVIALMHIVSGLNTMNAIVLDLVGQREVEGFDEAQERWEAANDA